MEISLQNYSLGAWGDRPESVLRVSFLVARLGLALFRFRGALGCHRMRPRSKPRLVAYKMTRTSLEVEDKASKCGESMARPRECVRLASRTNRRRIAALATEQDCDTELRLAAVGSRSRGCARTLQKYRTAHLRRKGRHVSEVTHQQPV
jgi:hypothetical protein